MPRPNSSTRRCDAPKLSSRALNKLVGNGCAKRSDLVKEFRQPNRLGSKPIHIRHLNVHQNEVEGAVPKGLNRMPPVSSDRDRMVIFLPAASLPAFDSLVVFSQENSQMVAGRSGRGCRGLQRYANPFLSHFKREDDRKTAALANGAFQLNLAHQIHQPDANG